jgi:tetratricopeptide (TPR) repeat protein
VSKKKARKNQLNNGLIKEIKEPVIKPKWYSPTVFKIQVLVLIIIGLICYANTFNNDYALDDTPIIKQNEFVQQGFQGISTILSSDAFASLYHQQNSDEELSGGRYRPLSIVTFAIEQQLFGSAEEINNPSHHLAKIRHIGNIVLYILSVIFLLYFLRNYIFIEKPIIAFITALLFLVHPIHTEVVANIKSRDEILSFLFVILTLIYVFRYADSKKPLQLIMSLVFYFLAFLSKEYAIGLLVFIPMLFYIVRDDTLQKSISKAIPFLAVAIVYILIRYSIVGIGTTTENTEIMNNPFLYATTPEKWATKIEILIRYMRLLFYPHPLSSDYSYATIPYTNFSNSMVWLSIVIHLSLIVAMIILFFKRNILSFAIAFYLLNLLLISNLVFDIGGTMGERLAYNSSLGLVMAIAIFMEFLLGLLKYPSVFSIVVGGAIGSLIIVWCAIKDHERNAQWKDDKTLFLADVKTVPNSILANGNAGKDYIDISQLPENKNKPQEYLLLDTGIAYLNKAVSIHPKFVNGLLNLGYAFMFKKEYEKAKNYVDSAKAIYAADPYVDSIYRDIGSGISDEAVGMISTQPAKAIVYFKRATEIAPNDIDLWNNYGYGCIYISKDYNTAKMAFDHALQLDPYNKKALAGSALLVPVAASDQKK